MWICSHYILRWALACLNAGSPHLLTAIGISNSIAVPCDQVTTPTYDISSGSVVFNEHNTRHVIWLVISCQFPHRFCFLKAGWEGWKWWPRGCCDHQKNTPRLQAPALPSHDHRNAAEVISVRTCCKSSFWSAIVNFKCCWTDDWVGKKGLPAELTESIKIGWVYRTHSPGGQTFCLTWQKHFN